jgi:hypothetical protein
MDFEKIYLKCKFETLREMASPSSKQLAKTFTGILESIDISDGITEEKLKQAVTITIEKFGLGIKQGLNFNFTKEEENSNNPKEVYLQNFAMYVTKNIGYLAQSFHNFVEKIKEIFRSALENCRIFK